MYEFIPTDEAIEKYSLQETRFVGNELLSLFKVAFPTVWSQGEKLSTPPLLSDRVLISNPVLPRESNGSTDDSVANVYLDPDRKNPPIFIGILQLAP